MRNLKLVLVLGLAACGGTDPSASGVFPAEAFSGTKVRVEISGDATDWKDGATVTLGDGVTVNSVTVASPTDLFAEATIDPAATLGLRDVVVSSGGSFTLKQAFAVKSPIELAFVGDVDQGAFPAFTIINHNPEQPFSTSTPPTINGPAGTNFSIGNNTELSITGFMSIDTDAMSGPVTVDSGAGMAAFTAMSAAVTINPRTPTALTAGTPATGNLAMPNDTQLYSIPATASQLVHFSIATADQNASPVVAILGPSGHWADQLGSGYAIAPQAGTLYAVVFDGGSEAGYAFNLTGAAETVTAAAEGNDTANNAVNGALDSMTLPFEQTGGSMSSGTDKDFIKVTVDAAHANKRVHIVTNGGADARTNTAVDVLGGSGNNTSFITDPFTGAAGPVDEDSQCSLFGCANGGEDVVSNALPVGTYYVVISSGGTVYSATHKNYTALIWFE